MLWRALIAVTPVLGGNTAARQTLFSLIFEVCGSSTLSPRLQNYEPALSHTISLHPPFVHSICPERRP